MKSPIAKAIILLLSLSSNVYMKAQVQSDPGLTAAVTTSTVVIGDKLDDIHKKQNQTILTNTAIFGELEIIREYDKTMLDYLKKAHGVFDNIYTAVNCLEMGTEIVSNLGKCANAAVDHPQGVIVSAMVSKEYRRCSEDILGLVGNITTLVKGSGEKNLLSSAERIQILYNINYQMKSINRRIKNLRWAIECSSWNDLFREINPDIYYSLMDTDRAYKNAEKRINNLAKRF